MAMQVYVGEADVGNPGAIHALQGRVHAHLSRSHLFQKLTQLVGLHSLSSSELLSTYQLSPRISGSGGPSPVAPPARDWPLSSLGSAGRSDTVSLLRPTQF